MTTSATASSARSHDRSPYRHALDGTQRALELALSRAPSSPESSVSISRNAKGVAQFEVTVRGEDIIEIMSKATLNFAALEALYPYPVEASVSPQEPAPVLADGHHAPGPSTLARARGKAPVAT